MVSVVQEVAVVPPRELESHLQKREPCPPVVQVVPLHHVLPRHQEVRQRPPEVVQVVHPVATE